MSDQKIYIVKFAYMDGQHVNVEIPADQIERFMAAIGNNEVWFNSEKGRGVWMHMDKMRYFEVEEQIRVGDESDGVAGEIAGSNVEAEESRDAD